MDLAGGWSRPTAVLARAERVRRWAASRRRHRRRAGKPRALARGRDGLLRRLDPGRRPRDHDPDSGRLRGDAAATGGDERPARERGRGRNAYRRRGRKRGRGHAGAARSPRNPDRNGSRRLHRPARRASSARAETGAGAGAPRPRAVGRRRAACRRHRDGSRRSLCRDVRHSGAGGGAVGSDSGGRATARADSPAGGRAGSRRDRREPGDRGSRASSPGRRLGAGRCHRRVAGDAVAGRRSGDRLVACHRGFTSAGDGGARTTRSAPGGGAQSYGRSFGCCADRGCDGGEADRFDRSEAASCRQAQRPAGRLRAAARRRRERPGRASSARRRTGCRDRDQSGAPAWPRARRRRRGRRSCRARLPAPAGSRRPRSYHGPR